MKLYSYFRSSAVYRVRIALNYKGLDYDTIPVHLLRNGGEQYSEPYKQLNPQQLIPLFIDDAGEKISQSLAILEYLEEAYPSPPMLPTDRVQRARVRSVALAVACDMHPLNNLGVHQYLQKTIGMTDAQKDAWYKHWIARGFTALQTQLASYGGNGPYAFGDQVTFADACLIPQIYNAKRFKCELDAYPTLLRIYDACMALPAFQLASPESQPDAEG